MAVVYEHSDWGAVQIGAGSLSNTYQEPLHLRELEGGIAWAAGVEGEGCWQARGASEGK
jgi:hypothetical protein